MSRRFRLQTLQRLRAMRLDAAAVELAGARRALTTARAEVQALTEEALACVAPAHAAPMEVSIAGARRELLRERAARATELVRQRQEELDAAVAAWHAARAALRAVESLHERHRAAVAEADARREQRHADELASVAVLHRPGPGGDAA